MRLRKPPLGVVNHLKSLPAIHKSVITPGPKLKLEISAEKQSSLTLGTPKTIL